MLTVFCLFTAPQPAGAAPTGQSAIVIHANTGDVIHACHEEATRFPASLTKIMTLYMVFEALEQGRLTLDQALPVSRQAARQPRVKLDLKHGETITVEQAILALVARSANDVATVVAEAIGGTEEEFAHMMTMRANSLGMKDTLFRNASGLPNAEQVTSAKDMARLAEAIWLRFPNRFEYFNTQAFSFGGKDYESHNKLLKTYEGADGMKTGYTRASGFNLVSSAIRKGHRLIAVVIGGTTGKKRDTYMEKILDFGFDKLLNGAEAPPKAPPCGFK